MKTPDPEKIALNRAFRLLSYRARSEKEISEKLSSRGFDHATTDKVISRLKSSGMIDDAKLASSLVRMAAEYKHLGAAGTRRFLAGRGIPRPIISDTLKELDELGTAEMLVRKKMKLLGSLPEDVIIRKLYGILVRKGYSYEVIKKVLGRSESCLMSSPDSEG